MNFEKAFKDEMNEHFKFSNTKFSEIEVELFDIKNEIQSKYFLKMNFVKKFLIKQQQKVYGKPSILLMRDLLFKIPKSSQKKSFKS